MPPAARRPRRTQEERTALSDARMTRAAIELLVERGIDGTTLAAIGERAGYSRGLALYRFGSKAGLFAHVLGFLGAQWRQRLNTAVGERTGLDAIMRAVDALSGFIREEPADVRALYLLWFNSIDPGAEYRADVAAVHEAQRRDLERWVRQGRETGDIARTANPPLVAKMLAVSIAGLVFHWLVNPSLPIAEMHRQLKRDITRLLASSPAAP